MWRVPTKFRRSERSGLINLVGALCASDRVANPLGRRAAHQLPQIQICDLVDRIVQHTTSSKHGKDSRQSSKGCPSESSFEVQEQEAYRVLFVVHLQGVEASAPRHRNQQEGHVDHELFHQ